MKVLVAAFPERFARLVISNTYLPAGESIGPAFDTWRSFSQATPDFKTGRIVHGGCVRELSSSEVAAYDAPYPDEDYQAGARQFPLLVPISPEHASVAENKAASTCFGEQDKVPGHLDAEIQRH